MVRRHRAWTAATAGAAVSVLLRDGTIRSDETTVVVLTGHGLQLRRGLDDDRRQVDRLVRRAAAGELSEIVTDVEGMPGLYCAPATIDLSGAEIELVPLVARESRLLRAIEADSSARVSLMKTPAPDSDPARYFSFPRSRRMG